MVKRKFKEWVYENLEFLTRELKKPEFRIKKGRYPEEIADWIKGWCIQLSNLEDVYMDASGDIVGTTRSRYCTRKMLNLIS